MDKRKLMTEKKPLILQIQENSLDSSVPVSQILRMAKVAATKLELKDFLKWINEELDGYTCEVDELPSYRMITGTPKVFNPRRVGWDAIIFDNPDLAKLISTAPIDQAIGPMEELLFNRSKGKILVFPYSPKQKIQISSMLKFPADVHLEIPFVIIAGIVDRVRNILLDWSLELEKSGVLGEGMAFDSKDKKEATTVTQHINAEMVNVTGQVNEQASVTQIQENYRLPLDIQAVINFTEQAKEVITQLPQKIQDDAQKYTGHIIEETSKKEPDHSRIRSLLTSLKTVCEAAAGNLAAQGIMSMIGNFL